MADLEAIKVRARQLVLSIGWLVWLAPAFCGVMLAFNVLTYPWDANGWDELTWLAVFVQWVFFGFLLFVNSVGRE